jgi:mannose/fructose/N-acetylgalactosamine-specific phosphotransferase system component IIC
MSTLTGLLPLSLLGALVGLDVVSFPQAMISRPLVAATLAGALVGQPARGLVVGVVLELFALETLPVGASRYPEWGSASVVGGALNGIAPDGSSSALLIAVWAALVTAIFGGWSMVQHRRLIARSTAVARSELAAGSSEAVMAVQLRGLTADLVRGGLVTGLALALLQPLTRALVAMWTTDDVLARVLVISFAGAVGGASVWNVTRTVRHARWFLAGGLAVGLGLLVTR